MFKLSIISHERMRSDACKNR